MGARWVPRGGSAQGTFDLWSPGGDKILVRIIFEFGETAGTAERILPALVKETVWAFGINPHAAHRVLEDTGVVSRSIRVLVRCVLVFHAEHGCSTPSSSSELPSWISVAVLHPGDPTEIVYVAKPLVILHPGGQME
jgi:hypothetical protein